MSASELHRLGVLTSLVENEKEFEMVTEKLVNELLSGAPKAMQHIKQLTHFVNCHTHQENVNQTRKVFEETVRGPEALYGVSSFIQKQKPDWNQFYQQQTQSKL